MTALAHLDELDMWDDVVEAFSKELDRRGLGPVTVVDVDPDGPPDFIPADIPASPERPPRAARACEFCGAAVFWAVNVKSGRRMPVNTTPVAGGNVRVVRQAGDGPLIEVLTARRPTGTALPGLDDIPPPGEARFVTHHTTCPDVDKWSRR